MRLTALPPRARLLLGFPLLLVVSLPLFGALRSQEPAPAKGKADAGLVPENLALGKSAAASSYQNDSHRPAAGNDGDPETRWCADGGRAGESWQVDLGKPEEITGCRIHWEFDGRVYRYRIDGSADGKAWAPLVDQTAGGLRTQVQTHRFSAKDVRHVRVVVVGLPQGGWASFFECEVFGTRLVKPEPPRVVRPAAGDLLSTVRVPDGFKATLFAAPPTVGYPTCVCTAPDGSVLVGVDENGSLDARAGRGRVVRCIDTDDDGKADRFETFAGMDSPRGVWFDHNTLYVLHPPMLTAFHDDDGDGKSDRKTTLVSGLGFDLNFRGADHTTNGFRIGIDGWFYIAVGDYGAIKAKGTDGRTLQMHGGGVVRVRPDGTGLELVSFGQRNIYDVAVSPTLDLFTRDNTNDGGGWDVRLSHVIPTGNYGYPRLFVNFPDEIVQPLADYGGGSPCGSLFLDEPTLPGEFGHGLYTCEWGRSAIFRHPLTPHGAGWKAGQETFVTIPRPTDMDVDASGRLYISSWKDGSFKYSGPNVGFVVRVAPEKSKAVAFPDLDKATEAQLLESLASPSGLRRQYAQRAILRRGPKPELVAGLEKLASSKGTTAVRVAAIFTLKQLAGKAARPTLVKLTDDAKVREFALRALADDREHLADVPAEPFLAGLKDADPRVRLQACIGLGRLGKLTAAPPLLEATADADPLVAHVAVGVLVALRAGPACLAALDTPTNSKVVPGALRVLQSLHEPTVVDGVIARLGNVTDPALRRGLLRTLARLCLREAEWDGKWWGTRPDTTGPYFRPAPWSETDRIQDVLRDAFRKADNETLAWLIPELHRHRINLPEVNAKLLTLAAGDATSRTLAVTVLSQQPIPSAEAIRLFAQVGASAEAPVALREKAVRALLRLSADAKARDAAVAALTGQEKLPRELESAWAEFVRDGRHQREVAFFTELAKDPSPARRELALGVLATVAGRTTGGQRPRTNAQKQIDAAWLKPDTAVPLIRAVARLGLTAYGPQVRRLGSAADAGVAEAARAAAVAMRLDRVVPSGPLVGKLKYEEVAALVGKQKGDATLGGQLFTQLACVGCHTTVTGEPLKGPHLGGIATRYSRAELVESILRPSAKMAQGFETQVFTLQNGKFLTGFVVRESGDEIEIRDNTGAVTVLKKKDIDEQARSPVSVMPEKLADNLTVPELAALLDYLSTLPAK